METIGDYEYSKKDLIGHGAFAVVFKGRYKKKPDMPVAIKSITKKNLAKSQNLLSKEIKILKELSSLHHDNVVALLDCKETTHHVYLVMEYCNGGDLADYLHTKGMLSEDTIAIFLKQIAGAMKALVSKGIVHRDLKPQNLLLCHENHKTNPTTADIKLKIADFGFARFLQDGVMAATLCGSPMYMAPEVIMSLQYDAKADLWSIGTIVFQCLTGKAPFQAQTPQQLKLFYEKHSHLTPNIPSGTSPELKDLLLKMLKRNAKERVDFDEFFVHPFLTQIHKSKTSTAPVAVPSRRRASSSSASDSPSVKTVSASPLSGNMPCTPPSPVSRPRNEVFDGSPVEVGGFLKVNRDEMGPNNNSPSEDFVMVPDNLPADMEGGSSSSNRSGSGSLRSKGSTESGNVVFGERQTPKTLHVSPNSNTTYRRPGETSPSRPSTLVMASSPSSQPIPVPTQVWAFEQLQRHSPSSPSHPRIPETEPISSVQQIPRSEEVAIPTRKKSSNGPDIGSLSPPAVQFTIGTPPGHTWRRNSVTGLSPTPPRSHATPPTLSASPHRRKPGTTPPTSRVSHMPGTLAAIEGSPTQLKLNVNLPQVITSSMGKNPTSPSAPLNPPFGATRHKTCPENMTSLQEEEQQVIPYHSVYNQNITPKSEGRQVTRRRSVSGFEVSPPPYGQSPPNMFGQVMFVPPELAEETLMDKEHNETMSKLNFVLALVECITELAQSRRSPITDDVSPSRQSDTFTLDHISFISEGQRRVEQLVLYVRALQMLTSSLKLARNEITAGRLQTSAAVKTTLKEMNNYYHHCLAVCKQLHKKGVRQLERDNAHTSGITAERLIYTYAIKMCQTAALDEIFGNPQECFKKYQNAQILLHSLAQQAQNTDDRHLLEKYKESVERRLYNLQTQAGYIYSS